MNNVLAVLQVGGVGQVHLCNVLSALAWVFVMPLALCHCTCTSVRKLAVSFA